MLGAWQGNPDDPNWSCRMKTGWNWSSCRGRVLCRIERRNARRSFWGITEERVSPVLEASRDDAPECFQMGGKGPGGGADGGVERWLPSPQRTNYRRRRQGLGGPPRVYEAEGPRLRSRGVESACAGDACARTCAGGRLSCVIAGGQSDRSSNPCRTATASGKGQVLPGTAR